MSGSAAVKLQKMSMRNILKKGKGPDKIAKLLSSPVYCSMYCPILKVVDRRYVWGSPEPGAGQGWPHHQRWEWVRSQVWAWLSLVTSGDCLLRIGWHWPGDEVCRRINEIHLLSQAPAPAEVRREVTGKKVRKGYCSRFLWTDWYQHSRPKETTGNNSSIVHLSLDVLFSMCQCVSHEVQSIINRKFLDISRV